MHHTSLTTTMAASSFYLLHNLLTRRRDPNYHSAALKSIFFFMPTTLALATSLLILLYISSTSTLFLPHHLQLTSSASASVNNEKPTKVFSFFPPEVVRFRKISKRDGVLGEAEDQRMYINDTELFHDRDVFFENYEEMNRSFKIYVYSHKQDDPFANVLLPVFVEPGGNYASESYFKKNLVDSHFITKDPSTADLFFLPFSIARLRHDPRVGINGIQDFYKIIFSTLVMSTLIGIVVEVLIISTLPAIQLVVRLWTKLLKLSLTQSKLYALQATISLHMLLIKMHPCHKFGLDKGILLILHKKGISKCPHENDTCAWPFTSRSKLAFFAGTINSPVREKLLQVWKNDSEISVHFGHLTTSYSKELLGSKFCLHVKGFEVNTARIGDALYYGCVPVIIANHYDLPFQDILNWNSFSIVVATLDIPLLKRILQGISVAEYLILQNNVFKVRKHFQWHLSPVDYDAFYLVMYELWLRRSSSRVGS
ncbi:UNVERIFIED_CONTAM: putative glycosyltransferase [Sesamum radiatum]|uniref:Glycosyltransferase n=1 Tax=Sesamum radiatum TaxID=300843 RepID=A0AAW2R3D6_SESRA